MYKDKFDELWEKTINSVLYGISAKDIKGTAQLNEYLQEIVWEHTWGDKKLVPPERRLLDELGKEYPGKTAEIEKILSNITVGSGRGLYAGIAVAFLGIIMLFAGKGVWRIAAGVLVLIGIGVAAVGALQSSLQPKKAALDALTKAKEKCDRILS